MSTQAYQIKMEILEGEGKPSSSPAEVMPDAPTIYNDLPL